MKIRWPRDALAVQLVVIAHRPVGVRDLRKITKITQATHCVVVHDATERVKSVESIAIRIESDAPTGAHKASVINDDVVKDYQFLRSRRFCQNQAYKTAS